MAEGRGLVRQFRLQLFQLYLRMTFLSASNYDSYILLFHITKMTKHFSQTDGT